MLKTILVSSFIPLLLLLQGCSNDTLSAEDEVRKYIKDGIQAAENRSSGDLSDMIYDYYADRSGYDKKKLVNLLRAYFFRHKNIHLFTKIRDIRFLTPQEARVTLHVAMAGQVIADLSALASLRATLYKFELDLLKSDGAWQLRGANWEPAQLNDMN